MLTRETKILGWAKRHRYAAIIAVFALLAPTVAVIFVLERGWRTFNETFTATNIVGTSTITTPTYVVTGTGSPTITVCNANPPTSVQPAGSLCVNPLSATAPLYASAGGGSWAQVGAAGNAYSFYGDGTDGSAVLDGVATITLRGGATMVPSGNVYTAPASHELDFVNLTINGGITLKPAGNLLRVLGASTINGIISNDGADANSNGTGGAGGVGGWLGNGGNGGNGGVNSGPATNGQAVSHTITDCAIGTPPVANNTNGANGGACQGGSGGDKSGAGGGGGGTTNQTTSAQSPHDILLGVQGHGIGDSASLTGGSGGGGGRGDGFNGTGGGGGGGGAWIVFATKTLSGSGAVHVRGGAGGGGVIAPGSGGGGGGGGVVYVITNSTTISVTVDANGGAKGLGIAGSNTGGNGGNGLVYTFHG